MIENVKGWNDYRIKLYLNASHFIMINNKIGEEHPHTWEFAIYLRLPKTEFIEFGKVEKSFKSILSKYEQKTLNNVMPFITIIPTLENITDYFVSEWVNIASEFNGMVIQCAASETPTRTYIVNVDNNKDISDSINRYEVLLRKKIVSDTLNDIIRAVY